MNKLVIRYALCHFILSVVSACTHKEFYEQVQTTPVQKISSEEQACLSKGYRWFWKKGVGCSEKGFLQYCNEEEKLKETTKLTIKVIKNETGQDTCEDADTELKKLTGLYLNGLGIEDIYPLMSLNHLTILRLDENKIFDLYPLSKLKKLRVLRLDKNKITKIKHLANLQEIVVLRLDENYISDLFPLANLNKMAQINLNGNKIKSLEPLANLNQLRKVGLKSNKVDNVIPLSDLTYLEYINLEENPISAENFRLTDSNCPIEFGVAPAIKNFCESRRIKKR